MSYIPPNVIIPEDENNKNIINQNISNNSNIIPNELSQAKLKENLIPITKQNNNNPKNNLFKKADLNKPIKIYSDEEIIHYVHLIFLNNSSYFAKKQQYLMTKENLLKIIKHLGIIPNEIKLYEVDIIFKRICPKTNLIAYEDFMNILIEIVQKLFPKEFKKDKSLVTNFFFHNIFNIYNEIIFDESAPLKDLLKYQYSSLVSLLNIIPEDSEILVINSLLYTLNEIYDKYFIYNIVCCPEKFNEYIYENGNLSNLFNFCWDFEILPYIFSETQIVTYYNLVVDNNDLFKFIDDMEPNKDNNNGYFTFNNFILFFIHLSSYNYAKVYESILDKEKNETELSKLIMLLTKLECSKGMRNLIDNSLPNLSLIPNKELFFKYNFDYQQENGLIPDNFNNINNNDDEGNCIKNPINNNEEGNENLD